MKKVIAFLHTHWDREWYRTFEEFRLRLIEVFDEVLYLLESGDLPYFYFDGQVSALEDYLELRPEKTEQVKKFIKEQKLDIGPFYCSSDSFLISGLGLYNNLKLGIERAKSFGEKRFIGYIADSFGHSKDITSLLKSFNIDKAILWRGLGDVGADLEWNGIKVTNLIQGYFQDILHSSLTIEKKAENLKVYLDKISERSGETLLLPIGADHLAVLRNAKKTIEGLNKIYSDYKIILGTPFDYFDEIKTREHVEGEFLDNSKTFLLKGIYSSRPNIKRANAQSEWILTRIAEPLNNFTSSNKSSEIKYAYKELIRNQAHDSIYGCSLDEVAKDVLMRYKTVDTIANGVIKRILRDLNKNDGSISVINLSNCEYSGKVWVETEKVLPAELNALKLFSRKGFTDKKLYNINEIPITEDITDIHTYLIDVKGIEPFCLTKITDENICKYSSIKAEKNKIENKYIKIEIIDNDIVVTDKESEGIYKKFIKIEDRADIGDSYNFGALSGDSTISGEITDYSIKEVNQIRAILNVIYEIEIPFESTQGGRSAGKDKCIINCDFTLYNQSKMAEICINWENKSKNHILQIGFNLKEKITETISEDLFSTEKRDFDPDYDIYKHIPAKRGIELKTNTAPMQRFVNVQNLTLITKGMNEYEIRKNTIYLTLLRATGIISNPKNPCRGTPAGPPLKTPGLQCIGKNIMEFSFTFTNKEEEMFKSADEYYYPCVILF